SFGLIIVIPSSFLSKYFTRSGYGDINELITCPYFSNNHSEILTLNLDVEVGDIEVKYIKTSVDYLMKVEVKIEMSGANLSRKSYYDFLDITPELEDSNSTVNFRLEIISDEWYDRSQFSIQQVNTVVSIRKDVVLNLFAKLDNGDFEITVPYGVSIGDLGTNLSKGNIVYNFLWCTIEGNITGITNEGDLWLKSYNVTYTQDSLWMFNSTDGSMDIEISQYKEMGANITGTVETGLINFFYKDYTANIGALFYFPLLSGSPGAFLKGFNMNFQDVETWFISSDFPTKNNYNMTLYVTNPCSSCRYINLNSD
ncbi:MAG: hypothetical protein ACW99L_14735, partial [Promethearchaeota archaeon]